MLLSMQAENDELALAEEPQLEFRGDEGYGRFLDLHEHHLRFTNSKFGRQMDYLEYVRTLVAFGEIPRHQRLTKAYR